MEDRKSGGGKNELVAVPQRLISIFHGEDGSDSGHQTFERIHSNPAIFLVRNILTDSDIEYFDRNISQHESDFKALSSKDERGRNIPSDRNTTTSLFLRKSRDENIQRIESKAAGKQSSDYHPHGGTNVVRNVLFFI